MRRPFSFLVAATATVAAVVYALDIPDPPPEFVEAVTPATRPEPRYPTTTTTTPPTTTRATTTTAPPTTTPLAPPDALCGQWWPTAVAAGWDLGDLPTLDRVLYNESRCTPGLTSDTGDLGLAQLNRATWAHLWRGDGFTDEQIRDTPALNLIYARRIATAAEALGWCTWQPWHGFSGDYC